ncbi:hypothetical protein [Chryseobacterium jejuense]|uniref:Lipocalin-like domain-containing protein n=2 Tax=Chryseobacterium jejuense TaxID=445960 RepID=A0A2X2XLA7_CHRJE|nr:hypothetical protein [Chryseobacterium jejuense]SDI96101.1 hypothetical protein SAMN05421542_2391 [Chryseobacterium jejuense]SQB27150.1 Uncharacterised protein [Chryseobacterium jejuense]
MKSFNLALLLFTFCLIVLSFNSPYQQSYQKMIVGKWQPILSTSEGVEANGKRTVQNYRLSSSDFMQFNADGSITDSAQLYFSYLLDPNDDKVLSLFEGGNYERKFEIAQLDKTTMKIVMRETDKYKGEPFQITWNIVFKRK